MLAVTSLDNGVRTVHARTRKGRGIVREVIYALRCGVFLASILLKAAESDAGGGAEDDLVTLIFGPYVHHYSQSDDHNPFPWFTGIEWESAERWEVGGAFFRNSFYQPCGYLYGGKRWVWGHREDHLFFKFTAGALLGYVEPYEHKIPVNWNGIGVGIIPAVGYKYKRASTQVVLLGTSGVMLTVGYDIVD